MSHAEGRVKTGKPRSGEINFLPHPQKRAGNTESVGELRGTASGVPRRSDSPLALAAPDVSGTTTRLESLCSVLFPEGDGVSQQQQQRQQ